MRYLFVFGVLDRVGQVVERIAHLAGGDRGGGVLESLYRRG